MNYTAREQFPRPPSRPARRQAVANLSRMASSTPKASYRGSTQRAAASRIPKKQYPFRPAGRVRAITIIGIPVRPIACATFRRYMTLARLGRYELLEELHREVDGVVYKASDPLLERLVAIKTVELGIPGVGSDIVELSFERKARLAGALTHPNIVIVHDVGRSGDVAYVATELLEGRTLRAILDSGVALAPGTIERTAAQVADGLEFTHQHAIVHCDVNPSSIVVLDIGLVKLTHLGNALYPAGSRPLAGHTGSAPQYMSPEQASGAPVDARSDIFSLGVVLYEMLAGAAPFNGSTADEVVAALMNKKPVPPSTLNRDIPSGFDYIVARALAKDPDHRYQRARDMASDLRRWALEEAPFFPAPLPQIATVPATHVQTGGVVTAFGPAALDEALKTVASESRDEHSGRPQTRRQWLAYGVPAVLLALAGGWTMLARRPPASESDPRMLASAPPAPSSAATPAAAPPGEAAAPATMPPDEAPATASPPDTTAASADATRAVSASEPPTALCGRAGHARRGRIRRRIRGQRNTAVRHRQGLGAAGLRRESLG